MVHARLTAGSAALAGALACLAAIPDEASAAVDRFPYCSVSRGYEESTMNCEFATFDACLEELKGMRGYCAHNPYYVAAPPPPMRATPKRTRHRD